MPLTRIVRLMPVLDFGGAESRIKTIAEWLDRERYELRVCTFWKAGHTAEHVEEMGVPVDVLEVDPAVKNARATFRLWQYLRDVEPDILHSSIAEANFHGALAGAAAGVPVRIVEEVGIPDRSTPGRAVFAGIYRLVDAIVGVSEATCDYLRDREWAPADRVRLIHNCVRPQFLEPAPGEPIEVDASFRVVTVGRLAPVKNHKGLIRAFAGVVERVDDAELLIAGEGPMRPDLEALIDELELEEHVELLGFRDDVPRLLESADAFVLPSFSEGLSNALLEAMARGLPVVASDVGGNPEVVEHLGRRWLLAPRDLDAWTARLIQLAEMPGGERDELGERARGVIEEHFSPEVYTEHLEAMYDELLERS
ncbi:MAG: glycosyltransferase [Persicimonas sp.]